MNFLSIPQSVPFHVIQLFSYRDNNKETANRIREMDDTEDSFSFSFFIHFLHFLLGYWIWNKGRERGRDALWFRTTKNQDIDTWSWPFARPFANLITLLAHLFAPHCLLRTAFFALLALLLHCVHSFTRLLALSLPSSWESG